MSTKTYLELIQLPTFRERYRYLKLDGVVGDDLWGSRRWVNQVLYHSDEWLRFKDKVILRDNGCDLGVPGYEIHGSVLVHHINPVTYDDIVNRRPCIFDMNNVICTQLSTHNAIHYGDENLLVAEPIERTRFDTCPWRKR